MLSVIVVTGHSNSVVLERALGGELEAQGPGLKETHSGGSPPHWHSPICGITQEGRYIATGVLFRSQEVFRGRRLPRGGGRGGKGLGVAALRGQLLSV